ncbi:MULTISPECIES: hypothetical protein [Erwinia]|uniref:hypothetical protein n=1 Tax=Erwinia TaxID=551 RepID=UPI0014382AC0|nr:hypothetical protein [Erwinia rhapontici]
MVFKKTIENNSLKAMPSGFFLIFCQILLVEVKFVVVELKKSHPTDAPLVSYAQSVPGTFFARLTREYYEIPGKF